MKELSAQKGDRIKIRVVKLTYRSQQQTPGGASLRSYVATDEDGIEHLWHSSHLARPPYGAKPYVCDVGDGDLYLSGTVNHRWGAIWGGEGVLPAARSLHTRGGTDDGNAGRRGMGRLSLMRRSVLSWHAAVDHLPEKPVAVARNLRAKIDTATQGRPLSEMVDIDLGAAEVEMVEGAIVSAYQQRERDQRARSTI